VPGPRLGGFELGLAPGRWPLHAFVGHRLTSILVLWVFVAVLVVLVLVLVGFFAWVALVGRTLEEHIRRGHL